MTFTPDDSQRLALLTWYSPDDPRYLDPRHPLIKLAGEAGEILDLYGKEEYKPGFSWWDCKKCEMDKDYHTRFMCEWGYTPLVLDELGDFWYYLRILTWQQGKTTQGVMNGYSDYQKFYLENDLLRCLASMARLATDLLSDYVDVGTFEGGHLQDCVFYFLTILSKLDCTLLRLTELNYQKLNSKPGAHGWKVEG